MRGRVIERERGRVGGRERQRASFHPLIYSPKGWNCQSWGNLRKDVEKILAPMFTEDHKRKSCDEGEYGSERETLGGIQIFTEHFGQILL